LRGCFVFPRKSKADLKTGHFNIKWIATINTSKLGGNILGSITSLRAARLKDSLMFCMPTVCSERAVLMTEADKKYQGRPMVLKRALMLSYLLEHMTVAIRDDELIVGMHAMRPKAAPVFFPESGVEGIEKELDGLPARRQDPFLVLPEDKQNLLRAFDYWRGRTIPDMVKKGLSAEAADMMKSHVFHTRSELGFGHIIPDYPTVLKTGLKQIKRKAQDNFSKLPEGERNLDKGLFWQAVIILCDAAIGFARRYAGEAERLASAEKNPIRKKELESIARNCRQVPENGAAGFHEALQMVWFINLMVQLESNGTGVSFGRMDQFLYPFYKKDMDSGKLNAATAQELLDCFFIKCNEIVKFRTASSAALWSGYLVNQNITIGGQTVYGEDAANRLTYMCLESQQKLRMREPQLSLRVHKGTPDRVLMKAAEVISGGGGKPQFVSDEVIIPSLMELGIPLLESRDYGMIGCVEPGVVGGLGRHKSGDLNLPKVLERALNSRASGFDTFEELMRAFREELDHVTGVMASLQKDVLCNILREQFPHVLLSIVEPDCVERGLDLTGGGIRHHWNCFTCTGLANTVNSLAAIKKVIHEQKKMSYAELKKALDSDFKGMKNYHDMLLEAPKYGNDDPYADAVARRVTEELYDSVARLRGPEASKYAIGYVTVTKNVSFGKVTGATPDGRRRGEPLADGVSPSHGTDREGPTAVMKSVGKLDLMRAGEGVILNLKFIPSALENESQRRRFIELLRTFLLDLQGLHVQFNVVSAKTLRDAQAHPEKHRDLLVRVAGYSAYFVELSRDVQDDIIGRTEYDNIS